MSYMEIIIKVNNSDEDLRLLQDCTAGMVTWVTGQLPAEFSSVYSKTPVALSFEYNTDYHNVFYAFKRMRKYTCKFENIHIKKSTIVFESVEDFLERYFPDGIIKDNLGFECDISCLI